VASGDRQVAIIGAGVAGLACGQELRGLGRRVALFDKGRAPGGRISTRRTDSFQFDHGAQFVSAKGAAFSAQLGSWADCGAVARWSPQTFKAGARQGERERWVGTPGMSAIGRALAQGLSVEQGRQIRELRRIDGAWQLLCDAGHSYGPFECVVVAVPAPQAVELVSSVPALVSEIAAARLAPCWALMAAWQRSVAPTWDIARGEGALAWVCKNSSKPIRAPAETWVTHADPEWTRSHLEADAKAVARLLSDALAELLDTNKPDYAVAHRWRYARVEQPVGQPYLFEPAAGLGICGDWLLGPRVECAYDSGLALARRIAR
jgi:renalase